MPIWPIREQIACTMSASITCWQPLVIQCLCLWPISVLFLDFRRFDSTTVLIVRGGVLRFIGNFPELLSQRISVGMILVGRLAASRARPRPHEDYAASSEQQLVVLTQAPLRHGSAS